MSLLDFFRKPAVAVATATAPVAAAAAQPAPAPVAQVTPSLARILRPQAAYRWLLPQLAAITPQYIEMVLRGALAGNHVQQWELFSIMEDSWPRLGKNLAELKHAVRGLKLTFTPYTEEDEQPSATAEERCQLVSAAFRGMRPEAAADENGEQGTIFDIMDAWAKGMSVLEVDWHHATTPRLGTFIAPRCTYWVHPVCYAWSMDGRIGLRTDVHGNLSPGNISTTTAQPMPSAVMDFPADKFLIGICKARSGTALAGPRLRALAWWWCAANFSADWLLNLAQVFGLPFRWANYDPNAPQSTVDAICNMLQNMGHNAWAAFPAGTTIDLKSDGMKAGSQTPQGDMLDRADKNCDLLILGQTLTSDSGGMGSGSGSLALGKVHEGVKGEIVESAAHFVADVLNSQLVRSILRLNYGDDSEAPTVALVTEEEEDLAQKAAIVQTLAASGADKIIGLDWISTTFGIPKPAPGEATLADGKTAANPGSDGGKSPKAGEAQPGAADDEEADAMAARIAAITDDALFAKALELFATTRR